MSTQSPQPNLFPGGSVRALSGRFWGLLLLTAIGAGLGAAALMLLLRAVQHVAWDYRSGGFLDAVRNRGAVWRIAVLVLAGVIAGTYRWARELGPGGHGGELAEAIWFRSGRVPIVSTIGRAALSIVIVAMGASLGREAAPKQTGAAIAGALSSWGRLPPAERRLLAACGAGAGMGAVYNMPFGGGLFALEALLGSFALPVVAPALLASLVATVVSWLVLPNAPTYTLPTHAISASLIVWAAIAGPLAGVAAAFYVRLIALADLWKPEGWPRLVVPILVFAVLGALAIPFPELLGNGKDVVQEALAGKLAVLLLAALIVLKPLATAACLGSGAPGGLFTPTLTFGALLGALFGHVWGIWWPGTPVGLYAIVGAAAVWAAASQAPVSALVFICELTWNIGPIVVPLILAIGGAVTIARLIEARSIYSARIHTGKAVAKEDPPRTATGFDDLVSQDFDSISAAVSYVEVLRELVARDDPSRPLYVVDETGKLTGEISPRMAAAPDPESPLVEIATAADLARPVEAVRSSAGREEALRTLRAAGDLPVPVVDAESGRPIGVMVPRAGEDRAAAAESG
jgi:H+/Cl- antiporter ClcA